MFMHGHGARGTIRCRLFGLESVFECTQALLLPSALTLNNVGVFVQRHDI